MSESKPSGLKPPSKIGRPCSAQLPKPAVPPSPPRSSSSDSTSISNSINLPRKRNPFDELDDGSISSGRRTSSASDRKSSLGSDSLWGDARRLSEAGIRRTSDSSVILTEDTDSFIIGDKIWVGGSKPGTIAYIGETHFAPQDWAGIVLDEPIGKNDGSVGNIRYFQCDPKRGIFCRLTRLTRTPLVTEGDVSFSVAGSGVGATPRADNGNMSIAASRRPSRPMSPPSSASRPPSSASGRELKVGDRVIVMSSTGSKAGMLRYVGKTEFATGDWCGVQCDDPVGKNDGSVQGVRYFSCEPMYGLFAPMTKVSLSPSPHRRPSCAVHPPGMIRQNTKDSITSSVSSKISSVARVRLGVNSLKKMSRPGTPSKAASATNSTEAILKDKEVYIEQLLKERDLERLAVTRAATQAEEAERQLDIKKQELKQVQEVAESTKADLLHQIAELTREKRDVTIQLDDEHSKLDDINFRFEEESLARSELEADAKMLKERITQLEQLLSEETKRAEKLELETDRLFETDESLAKLKALLDEKDTQLKLSTDSSDTQVQQLNVKLEQVIKDYEEVKKAHQEEKMKSAGWMNTVEENVKLIKEKDEAFSNNNSLKEQLELEVKNLNQKLTESELQIKSSNDKCATLKLELEELKIKFDKDKNLLTEEIKILSNKSKTLGDENIKNTSELTVLNLNITQLQNKLKIKEDEIVQLKEVSDKEKTDLKDEITDFKNKLISEAVDFESKEEILKMEIRDLKQLLLDAKKDLEEKEEKLQSAIKDSNNQVSVREDNLKEKEKQLINIKNEYEAKIEDLKIQLDSQSKSLEAIKDSNCKLIFENEELKKELESTKQSVLRLEDKLTDLSTHSESQKNIISVREEEIKNITQNNEETSKSLSALTLELGDWKRKFLSLEEKCAQITEQKTKLENDLSEIINSSSDSSQQLSKLNDTLRAKEKECTSLQEDVTTLRLQADSDLHKLQQELKAAQEKAEADLENLQKRSDESLELKDKECISVSTKLTKLNEVLTQQQQKIEQLINKENETESKLIGFENLKQELQYKLEKEIKTVAKLNSELEENRKGAGEVEIGLRNSLEALENERNNLVADVKDLKSKVDQTHLELENKKTCEKELNESINILRIDKENAVLKLEDKILILTKDMENLKKSKEVSDSSVCDKDIKIVQLQQQIEMLKSECQQQSDEVKSEKISNNQLREELLKINNDALNSTNKADELESKLQQQINITNMSNKKLEEIKTEKDAVITNLQKELENLKHELSVAHKVAQEKESTLISLNTTLDSASQSRDKILNEIKLSKSQADEKVLSLEKELAANKTNYENECEKLKLGYEVLEAKLKESEEKQEQLLKSLNGMETLESQLQSKQNEIETLKQSLDLVKREHQEFETIKSEFDRLKQEKIELFKDLEGSINTVENMKKTITIMQKAQHETEQQLKYEQEALKKSIHYKEKYEAFEKQVKDISRENEEMKIKIRNNSDSQKSIHSEATNNNNSEDIDLHMQIEFLNSIIGDLQRKVEEQEQEIQELRKNVQPSTTRVARVIAPRLFCDICDQFDLHDTEDCPRQAMDSPPPHRTHNKSRDFERPYCDSCEVFGHDTADCEETY